MVSRPIPRIEAGKSLCLVKILGSINLIIPLSLISSKDAYMLIYAKKACSVRLDASNGLSSGVEQFPQPPARAVRVVHSLNASHDALCEKFLTR